MVDDSFINRRVGQMVDAHLRQGKNWDFARRVFEHSIKGSEAALETLGRSLEAEDQAAFRRELAALRIQLENIERAVLGDDLLGRKK